MNFHLYMYAIGNFITYKIVSRRSLMVVQLPDPNDEFGYSCPQELALLFDLTSPK